ncbi:MULTISPECIES: DUF6287 domain-containing protein [Streptococcus]|jgi:uncharacterized protein YcfL|uniref:DUF6287 domain-containing protein n=3 Tax=Streptococcus TaxID=1301 RepID=A0A6N7WQ85_STRAY|nr:MULTISPECIES: DUF6287 domain-containing protein [Streptococcus]MCF2665654.1 hypothetical protein [Streptococcus alactolyticus]MCF2678085.1 hypothetical protein [Streptococcus alactolyticus]MCI6904724.1 DUF6287 domain-containing protein [Streptococcus alactolyticus]MDD7361414.1 DUF6287 domain-containing protein [Streptococcus alactolyticus]MDY5187329.1 DUF6287 domain-containing protein [Streptococcus alactolyticus]
MKKFVLLGIMVLLLSGCSKKSDSRSVSGSWNTNSSETISSSSSTVSQTESNEEVTSNNSIYDVVLEKLRNDTSESPATHYAYYDIDGNGQDELFSGRYWESTGTIEFAALYYDNNGVADYLAQSYVASAGGYREAANIYTDGTVITAKWMSTGTQMEDTQYQLRADNRGVDVIKNANVPIGRDVELSDYFDIKGKKEFDFSILDWQPLASEQTSSGDLNIDQILNGDYTSLAGTWKNGRGQTFEFSDEGMLEGMNISSPRESSYGTVILACGAANGAPGGFAIEVYPTGVKNPKGDHSDSSQPRLIAGQQFIDFPAEAYYYRE